MKRKSPRKPKKHFGFDQIYDGLNMAWIPVWTLGGKEVPTPPNMPSEITVLGQKYRVRYRPGIYSAPKKSAQLDGIVIFSHRLIMIESGLTLHQMRETLYHEAAHVYLQACQMKDPRLAKITPYEIEGFCDLFGEAVCDLALNNPLPK